MFTGKEGILALGIAGIMIDTRIPIASSCPKTLPIIIYKKTEDRIEIAVMISEVCAAPSFPNNLRTIIFLHFNYHLTMVLGPFFMGRNMSS